MASKIRQGDKVICLSGKDKGREGQVLKVLESGAKVLVDGLNMVHKHVKPNPNTNEAGGIKEYARPMASCKVGVVNPVTGKADRVGFKILENGRKVRIFKSTGEQIDVK